MSVSTVYVFEVAWIIRGVPRNGDDDDKNVLGRWYVRGDVDGD